MTHTDHKISFLFSATSSQNQEHISTMLALCQPPSSRYTRPFTSDQIHSIANNQHLAEAKVAFLVASEIRLSAGAQVK